MDHSIDQSMASWDFPKDQVVVKPPKLLEVPVARDILFSTEGKYVPFDIDHRNIYRHYLRSDLYLIDCQSYADKPETPAIMMDDLHEAFRYADQAVQWYEQAVTRVSSPPQQQQLQQQRSKWYRKGMQPMGAKPMIPNGVLPAKFLEYTSQYLLSK